jgi:hypothetical protein|tara:strand:- start:5207 stop:6025 length:819 start_codon:yes stop_codon:yes gene_type:complete
MYKLLIIFLLFSMPLVGQEIITGFEERDLPILNEELRKTTTNEESIEVNSDDIDTLESGEFKVKVSSDDTTGDYLLNKLVAGTGITLTETGDGGDEDITVATTTGYAGSYVIGSVADSLTEFTAVINTWSEGDVLLNNSQDWNGKKVHVTGVWEGVFGVASVSSTGNPNVFESSDITGAHPLEDHTPIHANAGIGGTSRLAIGVNFYAACATSTEQWVAGVDGTSSITGIAMFLYCDGSGHLYARFKLRQTNSGGGIASDVKVAWSVIQEVP